MNGTHRKRLESSSPEHVSSRSFVDAFVDAEHLREPVVAEVMASGVSWQRPAGACRSSPRRMNIAKPRPPPVRVRRRGRRRTSIRCSFHVLRFAHRQRPSPSGQVEISDSALTPPRRDLLSRNRTTLDRPPGGLVHRRTTTLRSAKFRRMRRARRGPSRRRGR